MKILSKIPAHLLIVIALTFGAKFSQAQELEIVNMDIVESSDGSGEVEFKGSVKNPGPVKFEGEVILNISGNRAGGKNQDEKINLKHSLGVLKVEVKVDAEFNFKRNIHSDSVNLRNIICVWPSTDKVRPQGKGEPKNIICVWPRKSNAGGKDGKKDRIARNDQNNAVFKNQVQAGVNYQIFPNPLVNITYVSIESNQEQKVTIAVLNNFGQIVKSVPANVNEGGSFVEIDMNDLGSGVYFFRVSQENKNSETSKVIKQ
ncbi:MAG: hypothetical protein A3H98_01530 [Bacteroidetes bacterium RIFCSPLOWO2_02_FULL_36_8]|nr:MAG: hypothetical protein A3H98_01530 [Bacteroidetes bacterium RIFCSPLOWO2_02_FULL_36_8]OFY69341.1 MAG: hypothetical protein A3G23_00875 [Bacteroidetes bacterium RIFCSPLOWO2_12_FULL_37_12]